MAVTVGAPDAAIFVVDYEFSLPVPTDLASAADRLIFLVAMGGSASGSGGFYIPTSAWGGRDMNGFSRHGAPFVNVNFAVLPGSSHINMHCQ